jgi:Fe-S-cluster containining protein
MDVRRLVVTNQDSSPLCRDCGFCCTLVVMSRTAEEWLESTEDPRQVKWFESDLEELCPYDAESTGLLVPGLAEEGLHFYRCGMWDQATGRCSDYDNRPQSCRSYPYYLMGNPGLKTTYANGCRLADYLYSLLDLRPEEVTLRKNGHA